MQQENNRIKVNSNKNNLINQWLPIKNYFYKEWIKTNQYRYRKNW